MAWSYSGNPKDSQLDHVRFLIGDTDEADQLLQDEEINFSLVGSTPIKAAIICVKAIIASLAKECDSKLGPISETISQRFDHYKLLLVDLEATAKGATSAVPIIKQTQPGTKDSSPIFNIGMMDHA